MWPFSRKKTKENVTEETPMRDFTFIWWEEMNFKGGVHYTRPFRTTVKGKSYDEAVSRLQNLVVSGSKLRIVPEQNFDKTKYGTITKNFDKAMSEMSKIMETLKFFNRRDL